MATNRDPTPEQIEQRAAEIRKGWSEVEHFRRLRSDLRPTHRLADGVREDIDAASYEAHHASSLIHRD